MESQEINLKKFIKQYGLTSEYCAAALGIDRQKFWRWCKPENANYKVLKTALKFLIRCQLSLEECNKNSRTDWESAEREFNRRMGK
jgi:predicted DNA-binding protein (UPF0251 family)